MSQTVTQKPASAVVEETGSIGVPILFAVTLFVSALLLFLVQPMIAKMILPFLGGSPAVWNTCQVFFQAVLLVGYTYAHVSTGWLGVRNQGWMHLGLSRDTTAFACESLRLFWHSDGQRLYPHASAILLLCDGGGSNSCHKHLFKEDLQGVANDLDIPIRVAHYPAYCSKFNPIERRLFRHVTRACQGVLFDSLHTVRELIQKTKTQQGLSVTVRLLDKLYEGGRTVSEAFKKRMPIVFETLLPQWNYWAVPQ